nr:unnamed protein product [Callosobruchus analis]
MSRTTAEPLASRFAGNKTCIRDASERFGIGTSRFFRQQTTIKDFFIDLAPAVISFPRDEDRKEASAVKFLQGLLERFRVFRLSCISREIPEICGEIYHLLGDSAYCLREYLMTPYRDCGQLTDQQKKFSRIFSATRVQIESTFGLLRGRWRQLLHLEFHEVDKITNFIMACCVLHNICIDNVDLWDNPYVFGNHDLENDLRWLRERKRE